MSPSKKMSVSYMSSYCMVSYTSSLCRSYSEALRSLSRSPSPVFTSRKREVELVESPESATPARKIRKRLDLATDVEDGNESSEVELVAHVKHKDVPAKPRPGSPAFVKQEPVTLTTTPGNAGSSATGRRLSFGTVDADADAGGQSVGSSKRARKPSRRLVDTAEADNLDEKSSALLDAAGVRSSRAPKVVKQKHPQSESEGEHIVDTPVKRPIKDLTPAGRGSAHKKTPRRPVVVESEDDDFEDVTEIRRYMAAKASSSSNFPSKLTKFFADRAKTKAASSLPVQQHKSLVAQLTADPDDDVVCVSQSDAEPEPSAPPNVAPRGSNSRPLGHTVSLSPCSEDEYVGQMTSRQLVDRASSRDTTISPSKADKGKAVARDLAPCTPTPAPPPFPVPSDAAPGNTSSLSRSSSKRSGATPSTGSRHRDLNTLLASRLPVGSSSPSKTKEIVRNAARASTPIASSSRVEGESVIPWSPTPSRGDIASPRSADDVSEDADRTISTTSGGHKASSARRARMFSSAVGHGSDAEDGKADADVQTSCNDRRRERPEDNPASGPDTESGNRRYDKSPELTALHERFPDLPKLRGFAILRVFPGLERHMRQVMKIEEDDTPLLSCADTRDCVTDETCSVLLDLAQSFKSYDVFANPATVDPDLFSYKRTNTSLHVVWKEKQTHAVFVMPGVVAECALLHGAEHGWGSIYNTKKLIIHPFEENWDHTISMFGSVCNFTEAYGWWVQSAAALCTVRENASKHTSSGGPVNGSPLKGSRYMNRNPANPNFHYPSALNFTDSVPIYNGTTEDRLFDFSDEAFDTIRKLPLYKGGVTELPPFSVIAAGFTFNVYGSGQPPMTSWNIMFAIYLGRLPSD
ncbi:hypothetical protein CPB84DRAFT_1846288 [Gymnopilus junonius]|uniref:Uncharacterized protein n=1 Tax=Gymnopilus junonius TaxID=109634 RepID=A0A9P5NR82_GYMJU|nr:hypothetical protein CPB84DRAFT_1846288 [Gymnopilus junonius]